ncbi:copper chaperone PCu(A)C [Saccharopolyspora erythraea]|nr:copper chaperone PCu(A)C [Saccharopolyspora erythraea]
MASAALGLGAVVALGGCSAGQVTETDTQVAAVSGGNGTVKEIAVRDAQMTFPEHGSVYRAGSSAPLKLVLSNDGAVDDRLVQVSSTYAATAQIEGTSDLPAGTALHADGARQESGHATTQQEPTSSHAPTASNAPSAQGGPSDQREIRITLNGLTQDITPGVTIPVTFVFEKAGAVTVQVPIGPDHKPRPEHGAPHGSGH